jgi:hypothetical protein
MTGSASFSQLCVSTPKVIKSTLSTKISITRTGLGVADGIAQALGEFGAFTDYGVRQKRSFAG